jgi:hypothetical protein
VSVIRVQFTMSMVWFFAPAAAASRACACSSSRSAGVARRRATACHQESEFEWLYWSLGSTPSSAKRTQPSAGGQGIAETTKRHYFACSNSRWQSFPKEYTFCYLHLIICLTERILPRNSPCAVTCRAHCTHRSRKWSGGALGVQVDGSSARMIGALPRRRKSVAGNPLSLRQLR